MYAVNSCRQSDVSKGVSPLPVRESTRNIIIAALDADKTASELTRSSILSVIDGSRVADSYGNVPLPVWARKEEIQRLTGCPDKWLFAFAVNHPSEFRKFASARNGSAVYRVSAVLEEIERMRYE